MLETAIVVLILIVMGVLIWFMSRKSEEQRVAHHLLGIGYELANIQKKIANMDKNDNDTYKLLNTDATVLTNTQRYACYPNIAGDVDDDKVKTYLTQLSKSSLKIADLGDKLTKYKEYLDKMPADTKTNLKPLIDALLTDINRVALYTSMSIQNIVKTPFTKMKPCGNTFCPTDGKGQWDDATGCLDPKSTDPCTSSQKFQFKDGVMKCV